MRPQLFDVALTVRQDQLQIRMYVLLWGLAVPTASGPPVCTPAAAPTFSLSFPPARAWPGPKRTILPPTTDADLGTASDSESRADAGGKSGFEAYEGH